MKANILAVYADVSHVKLIHLYIKYIFTVNCIYHLAVLRTTR